VKGSVLRAMPQPAVENAEMCFMQSLELSRQQGARAWELRTAIDLAAMLSDRGQPERARTVLKPVFEQFVEGFNTADPTAARNLLSTLG
jgi:hypothetical protein